MHNSSISKDLLFKYSTVKNKVDLKIMYHEELAHWGREYFNFCLGICQSSMLTTMTLRHVILVFSLMLTTLVSSGWCVCREECPIRIMRDMKIITVDFIHIFTKDLLRADSSIQVNVRKIHLFIKHTYMYRIFHNKLPTVAL